MISQIIQRRGIRHRVRRIKRFINPIVTRTPYELYRELKQIGGNFLIESRKAPIVVARQVFHYILKNHYTLVQIQDVLTELGYYQDHSTILHSIKVVNNLLDTNDKMLEPYLKIIEKYKNSLFIEK